MKVKELISYLKKKNPEDYVGILQYGQDTGDWIKLSDSKDSKIEDLYKDFKIIPKNFAEREMDTEGVIDDKEIQKLNKNK